MHISLAGAIAALVPAAALAASYDLTSATDLRALHGLGPTDPVAIATANDASDDDATVITDAMDAAAWGDVLTLPAGTFHLKTTAYLESGIELRGAGATSTSVAANFGGSSRLLEIRDESGVTVSNMRLKSHNTTTGLDHIVYVRDSTNIDIEDCIIQRFRRAGVYFNEVTNGRVFDTWFKDAVCYDYDDDAINCAAYGGLGYGITYTNGCDTGRVDGCEFTGPEIRHGVVIQGSKEEYPAGSGQYIYPNPSHGIIVKYNYFEDNQQDSIDLHGYGEYDNRIECNEIYGPSDPNRDVEGRGIGLGEYAHGSAGTGNKVQFNKIVNCRYGIHVLNNTDDVTIKYNLIIGSKRYGVYIQEGSNVEMRDNEIYDSRKWGVLVEDCPGFHMDNASLSGNLIVNNGLKSASAFGGVRIESIAANNGAIIRDNSICSNQGADLDTGTVTGTFTNNANCSPIPSPYPDPPANCTP